MSIQNLNVSFYLNSSIVFIVGSDDYHKQLEMVLNKGTISVRYTNLLLCGLPGSGRSSFLHLLLGGAVNDDNPIASMIMRTPSLKFEDLAKHRWEWDRLDYKTLKNIVTSHIKSCGATVIPEDMPEQSSSATSLAEEQPHHHSAGKHEAPVISHDEYSFEQFLIERLSLHLEHQKMILENDSTLEDMLESDKPEEKCYKMFFFHTEADVHGYFSLLEETLCILSQFKMCDSEQLLQKAEIVDSFIDKLRKLNATLKEVHVLLSQFVPLMHMYKSSWHSQNFDGSTCMLSLTDSIPFSFSASSSSSPPPPSKPKIFLPSHPSSVCNEILSALPVAELPDGKALHFINVVGLSGPLSFLNTIPSILSYTTVNLITHRLDIAFDERYCPESAMNYIDSTTHIDMLDNLIKSLSFSQKPQMEGITSRVEPRHNKKMFLVVGTCLDRINKVELHSKNMLLDKRFDKIYDTLLRDAGSILFVVDNLNPSGNEEKLMLIRRKVCKHYVEADIPIQWYLLQLELMRAQDHCDVLPFDEVLHIGEAFQMSGDDVKDALSFFHNMTIIFYFSSALPSKVFVNPSIFLAKLANATRKHQLHADVFCAPNKQLLEILESQLLDCQLLESHLLEIQLLKSQLLESQLLESQLLKSQRLKSQRLVNQFLESQLLESQHLENQHLESQLLENQRLESQRRKSQQLKSQLLESQLLESQLLEIQLLQSQHLESQHRKSQRQKSQHLKSQLLESHLLEKRLLEIHLESQHQKAQSQVLEIQHSVSQILESQQNQRLEHLKIQLLESQCLESQLLKIRLFESQNLEYQRQKSQYLKSQLLESQLLESQLLESQLLESQLLKSQYLEGQRQQNQHLKSQRLENQHLESQLLESQLLESQCRNSQHLKSQLLKSQCLKSQCLKIQLLESQFLESQLLKSHLLESQHLESQHRKSQHLKSQLLKSQCLKSQLLNSQFLESQRLERQLLNSWHLKSEVLKSQLLESQHLEIQLLKSRLREKWHLERQLLEGLLLVLQLQDSRLPISIDFHVIDPLVISWDHKIPCGLFYALCVKLGLNWELIPSQHFQNFVHFRDKQVTLIDRHCHWIEIHYEGLNFDACFEIKSEIHKALQNILALFNIDATVLPQKCEYFLCFAKHHQPDHLCIINNNKSAICVRDGSIIGFTKRQRPWLTPHTKRE